MEFAKLEEKDYPDFLNLYNQSFPADQRRIYKDEQHFSGFINEKGGKFNVSAAKEKDLFLGFISYWIFNGYVYVEHFAVVPEYRGKRIGTFLLNHLLAKVGRNVLLEVEYPEDPISEDRIRFYERNGFRKREEVNYMQPPYSPGQAPVKLLLMTHGEVKLNTDDDIREMLQEVYNVGCAD